MTSLVTNFNSSIAQLIVNWITTAKCQRVRSPRRRDSTRQFSRVRGVYWALHERLHKLYQRLVDRECRSDFFMMRMLFVICYFNCEMRILSLSVHFAGKSCRVSLFQRVRSVFAWNRCKFIMTYIDLIAYKEKYLLV